MAKRIKASRGKLKKRWFSLVAPKMFGNQSLGEIPSFTPDSILGRNITVNLMNLTKDMRAQNVNVSFVIGKVMGDKAYTDFIKYQIMPSAIKRLVRRAGGKVEYVFTIETTDNKKVVIKVLLVTRTLVKNSISTSLRKKAEDVLANTLKKMKYDEFVSELVMHKIQSNLKKQLHKIYPLRTCEIRMIKLVSKEKPGFSVVEEKPKEAEEKKEVKEEKPKKTEKKVEKKTEEKVEKPKVEEKN